MLADDSPMKTQSFNLNTFKSNQPR